MATSRPQFYENGLQLVEITADSLLRILLELRDAVNLGLDILSDHNKIPDANNDRAFGTIYNGHLGIVLMALRLQRQSKYLLTLDLPIDGFILKLQHLANIALNPHISKANINASRLSPLGSASFGAAVVRLIAAGQGLPMPSGGEIHRIHQRDVVEVENALQVALRQGESRGTDELLYGRVGLLHAMLNIRTSNLNSESAKILNAAILDRIPLLVDVIIGSGRLGARSYLELYGEQEQMPLMWSWHDKYYIGAIHGACGILAILLACKLTELGEGQPHCHIPIIAQTVNSLCKMCIENDGHLPSSVPQRPPSRASPLVQVCHGAPGLLILLSRARQIPRFVQSYWRPEWDEAIRLASEQIWKQGLLSKGGSLCHGIAGNAWSLLMMHKCFEYDNEGRIEAENISRQPTPGISHKVKLSGDYFLSRALTLLLEARQTKPFNSGTGRYRLPDNPYSLFEGLAGNICAWAEACVLITSRLKKMDLEAKGYEDPNNDQDLHEHLLDALQIPGFGVRGFL